MAGKISSYLVLSWSEIFMKSVVVVDMENWRYESFWLSVKLDRGWQWWEGHPIRTFSLTSPSNRSRVPFEVAKFSRHTSSQALSLGGCRTRENEIISNLCVAVRRCVWYALRATHGCE